jgi:hypothetical protein
MVLVVESRALNELYELKTTHKTVNFAPAPFLTPVQAVKELSFIKSCTRLNNRAFSVDYFTSIERDLN